MLYLGSKRRHAKEILQRVLTNRAPDQWYVEPFVGGANVIDKVGGPRIGADLNPDVIALWQGLQQGFVPPDVVTEEEYTAARTAPRSALRSFTGFGCSFGGKWFGGYARNAKGNDYCGQSKRAVLRQLATLRDVEFRCCSYRDLVLPPNSIVYCDPPYAGTTGYATGGFDHADFWAWCRETFAAGHEVFVSEYTAPDDFLCIWSKSVGINVDNQANKGRRAVERLFVPWQQL